MNTECLSENTVSLPGGLMLQQDQFLNTACLRPLSGREEEWLARHRSSPGAVRVSWLLNSCLLVLGDRLANRDLVRRLLVADRDYLVLQLRRLTFGDQVQAVVPCQKCSQKMDIDFQLNDVPVECRPQRVSSYTIELSDRIIRFRLPTGGDQEAVLEANSDDMADELMNRCVLDNGGELLSAEEKETVVAEMEQRAPQVEPELDLSCPECQEHFLLSFDTTAFFLDEMAFKSDELLREIHALAFHYHWSETEILKLDRRRRRAYLALLNESLRRDWLN
jgi:T4 bacteriophage base plate protein